MLPTSNNNNNNTDFSAYFQQWLARQETFLHDLLCAQESLDESHEDEIKSLIARVLAHYQQYFEEKSRMVTRNVFLMFSPTWFTPLEKSFLWIGGFKPCSAFKLLISSVTDLTDDQRARLEELQYQTKENENILVDEFAKLQESVAAPPIAEQAMQAGERRRMLVDGEVTAVEKTVDILKTSLENLIIHADLIRTTTAEKVVGILSSVQSLKFLAAAAQLQLRIRSLGIQKQVEMIRHAPEKGW